jgi:hypothetical protein
VQRWQAFALQEAGELESIAEPEVKRDMLRRADRPSAQEHRFYNGPGAQR